MIRFKETNNKRRDLNVEVPSRSQSELSLLCGASLFTSHFRGREETIPTAGGPKVTAASVRGETESEPSL